MKIGTLKAGGVPLVTLAVAGISKPFMEGMIARTPIGNGTLISGGAKLIGALAVRKFAGSNTLANGIQIGLAVDGMEDIIQGVMGGGIFGGGTRADAW